MIVDLADDGLVQLCIGSTYAARTTMPSKPDLCFNEKKHLNETAPRSNPHKTLEECRLSHTPSISFEHQWPNLSEVVVTRDSEGSGECQLEI